MTPKNSPPLSSRELLAKIGLDASTGPNLLLEDEAADSPLADLAAALRERFDALSARETFRPGDVVGWKPGLCNRRWPSPDKPAIVVEVLEAPVLDGEKDPGYPYFREPLDIALGVFVEDGPHRGDFMVWHFDSRRLRHWTLGE